MATLDSIITKVNADLDLDEEIFIDVNEKIAAANSALDVFEAAMIAEVPKYFQATPFTIDLIDGTQDYDLPTDIYANKMNLIYYSNGSTFYEIPQIKDLREVMYVLPGQFYRYLIVNSTASGTKIRFYPTPTENTTAAINIFYTRNIKRFTATTDTLDAPEAELFIKEFMKEEAIKKERLTPDAPMSDHLKEILINIITALKTMVVDENNIVPMDVDFHYALYHRGGHN